MKVDKVVLNYLLADCERQDSSLHSPTRILTTLMHELSIPPLEIQLSLLVLSHEFEFLLGDTDIFCLPSEFPQHIVDVVGTWAGEFPSCTCISKLLLFLTCQKSPYTFLGIRCRRVFF